MNKYTYISYFIEEDSSYSFECEMDKRMDIINKRLQEIVSVSHSSRSYGSECFLKSFSAVIIVRKRLE